MWSPRKKNTRGQTTHIATINTREQKRLAGHIKNLHSSQAFRLKEIDNEILSLKEKLIENEKIFGTRCDIKRLAKDHLSEDTTTHLIITKDDDFKMQGNKLFYNTAACEGKYKRTRRHTMASLFEMKEAYPEAHFFEKKEPETQSTSLANHQNVENLSIKQPGTPFAVQRRKATSLSMSGEQHLRCLSQLGRRELKLDSSRDRELPTLTHAAGESNLNRICLPVVLMEEHKKKLKTKLQVINDNEDDDNNEESMQLQPNVGKVSGSSNSTKDILNSSKIHNQNDTIEQLFHKRSSKLTNLPLFQLVGTDNVSKSTKASERCRSSTSEKLTAKLPVRIGCSPSRQKLGRRFTE